MKIIDNKKDYYDYVSGIYGIDPYVVYDRRGSEASSYIKECWPEIFDKNIIDSDKETYNRKYGRYAKDKAFIDKDFDIVIEAGEKHFFIKCNRRRETEDSPVELTYKFFDPIEMLKKQYSLDLYGKGSWVWKRYENEVERYKKKRSSAPLAIFITDYQHYWDNNSRREIKNPILKDLPITGLIPAEEIWQGIYDYLLKMKEPVIVDSRTNDEHIESAGFDKKTSFRNM